MQYRYAKKRCQSVVPFDSKTTDEINSSVRIADQSASRELITAQEKELTHIARELHDNLCQRLVLLSLKIEKAAKTCADGQQKVQQELTEIWRQCADLAGDVQALSHQLHPSILDHLGLVMAVTSFCRQMSEQSGATVKFVHKNVPPNLPQEVSLSLFRVVQEALHNSVKYSGGDWFCVSLQVKSGMIELEVRDWGKGFDVASPASKSGLGLVSMRERIQLLNGTFRIESEPNGGTHIHARVPLGKELKVLSFLAQ